MICSTSRQFSRASKLYDSHAAVQERTRDILLSEYVSACDPTSVVDLGCGTGALLEELSRRFPVSSLSGVDFAPDMIRASAARLKEQERVTLECVDIRDWTPSRSVDLIVSNATLHWLSNLADSIEQIASFLSKNGELCCSLMTRGTLQSLHVLRNDLFPTKPSRISLPSKSEFLDACTRAQLSVEQYGDNSFVEYYQSTSDMLRALKASGVNGNNRIFDDKAPALLQRRELAHLMDVYEQRYRTERGIPLLYEVLFVRARCR